MVKVELVFERPQMKGLVEMEGSFQATLEEVADWFKGFEVERIEIWIKAAVKSEGLVRLFVSAEGESGMKIILKPRD